MAIAHATAHTIIRVKTSDDAIVMQRSIRKIETILCQYSDEYVSVILLEQRRKHRADVDANLKRTHFLRNMGPSWSMAASHVRHTPASQRTIVVAVGSQA